MGMQRMDFETLVQTRKSVRGFKKEPVARAVIEDIIEVAKRAPSSMNTQPWHIHVLTGEPLEELRRRNMEEMVARRQGEARHRQPWRISGRAPRPAGRHRQKAVRRDGHCARRQADAAGLGAARLPAVRRAGVAGPDLRQDSRSRRGLPLRSRGRSATVIVLSAAWDRGLGSVINGQGIMRSDIVREVAGISEDEVIMTCVAMGYPDDSFPANAVRSDREANGDFVRYVGFAD